MIFYTLKSSPLLCHTAIKREEINHRAEQLKKISKIAMKFSLFNTSQLCSEIMNDYDFTIKISLNI